MENGCVFGRCGDSGDYTTFDGPVTLSGTSIFDTLGPHDPHCGGTDRGSSGLTKGIGYRSASVTTSDGTGTLMSTNDPSVTKAANIVLAGGTLNEPVGRYSKQKW
jgi:hypothetical protein